MLSAYLSRFVNGRKIPIKLEEWVKQVEQVDGLRIQTMAYKIPKPGYAGKFFLAPVMPGAVEIYNQETAEWHPTGIFFSSKSGDVVIRDIEVLFGKSTPMSEPLKKLAHELGAELRDEDGALLFPSGWPSGL